MTSRSPRHALVGWALTVLAVVGTAGLAGAAGAGRTAGENAPAQLLVFAAASLSEALDEVGRAFTARTGVRVNASYAASSVLAKQIEAGAPADAFFSADLAWVDYLDERGLLKRGADQARRVAERVGSPGAGRERARGARVCGARGGAAGHRLPDRRAGREARARGRCVSRGQPPTHHLCAG